MNIERKAILCIDDETIILDSLREQLEKNFGEDFGSTPASVMLL